MKNFKQAFINEGFGYNRQDTKLENILIQMRIQSVFLTLV